MSTTMHLIENTPEENQRIVRESVKRISADAKHAAFEEAMIKAVNQHCADSKKQQDPQQAAKPVIHEVTDEERRERAQERLRAMQEAQRQDREANKAVKLYALVVFAFLLLPTWTPFPLWASFTTALGLGVIFAVHVYRIFVPLEMEAVQE